MKIATYNIWHSEQGMPLREQYIIEEIATVAADVVCLQEVEDDAQARRIADACGYRHIFFDQYDGEEEGLCILSKLPFVQTDSWVKDINGMYGAIQYGKIRIGMINLHLPWDSALQRQRYMIENLKKVDVESCDYLFMVGDFNCSDQSDIQRYLLGECCLDQTEAKPCWFDLARAYGQVIGTEVENTLDFRHNPRFSGSNTIEVNQRFDRILLRNSYPVKFPQLIDCQVFGKTIYEAIGLSASDHYGVMVEMKF